MATPRLAMATTKQILILKWTHGLTHRKVAQSLEVSAGLVGTTVARAKRVGLTLDALEELDETELERRLFGERVSSVRQHTLPKPAWVHQELKRPGVTLELLHLEYLREHPTGYRYTTFCNHYRQWRKLQSPSMRQTHRAGEKLFVDYAGKRPQVVDRQTGEARFVELFVAVLGASSKVFAEATETQQVEDWVASHARAFAFYGGVPEALVPDQLRSAVRAPCRYEPLIQRTYAELARHYGCVVIPARPRKPKDKAKAEVSVQIVERWILARLRNEIFFSLGALNTRIAKLLGELNQRPMKKLGNVTRQELFERLERAHLKPLPEGPFVCARWKKARVNIDYHIEYEHHCYSVPHRLVRELVEVRATQATIEVYHRGKRIAAHRRGRSGAGFSTDPEHMPASHRAHAEWSPSRLIEWGTKMGPCTARLVESILMSRPHPEMGYRSCLGILRLEKRYGSERLESACQRALGVGARSYQPVAAILKNGLDQATTDSDDEVSSIPDHGNVRGPDYYH